MRLFSHRDSPNPAWSAPLEKIKVSKMKVIIFSSSTIPSMAANSIQVVRMAEAFHEEGHQVTLIARKRVSQQLELPVSHFYGTHEDFNVLQFAWERKSLFGLLAYVVFASAQVRKINPDIVVSRNLLASWLLSLIGQRTVHEAHSMEESFGVAGRGLLRTLTVMPGFVGFIAISKSLMEALKARFPQVSDRVLLAPDGARTYEVQPKKNPSERPAIGYIGSLYSGRGIELIVELAGECPWADFTIVGDVGQADLPIKALLDSAGPNLEIKNYVFPSESEKLLRTFDILLAPYQNETRDMVGNDTTQWMSPLKIFEYMASGTPIVASDLPAIREVLSDRGNALLVPAGQKSEWIKAITALSHDEELRVQLAGLALRDLRRSYTWRIRAAKIINFFELT